MENNDHAIRYTGPYDGWLQSVKGLQIYFLMHRQDDNTLALNKQKPAKHIQWYVLDSNTEVGWQPL